MIHYKTKLGIDPSFMIRFDNPFSNLDNAANNKAAVINTQLVVLGKVLEAIHTINTGSVLVLKFPMLFLLDQQQRHLLAILPLLKIF